MVGRTTSGAYGHALGAAVALGYVRDEGGDPAGMVAGAAFEIEVAGRRIAATASLKPLYDPSSQRVRA
jgi:4-methylaminobutanoate oxidase (formaldehyde-forming)